MRILGFMSGTSLDGVDAAILETDGIEVVSFGPAAWHPYPPRGRELMQHLTERVVRADQNRDPLPDLGAANAIVLAAHELAGRSLLSHPDAGDIEMIGFHGQTVLHRPAR